MRQNILILWLLFVLFKCNEDYYLSLEMLISGSTKYKLNLINKKIGISDNDLFYSGFPEYLEEIFDNSNTKAEKIEAIKEKRCPLVLMFDECLFEYIKYFSTDTIFVIDQKCFKKEIYIENYSDYTIFTIENRDLIYSTKILMEENNIYYIKIGKQMEEHTKIFFYIMIIISAITSIFLCFIMNRVLKNMDEENILLVNFLIIHLSDLLFMANVGSAISFFLFMGKEALDFLSEYIIVFLLALYKGCFYTTGIILLQGWMTTTFINLGDKFKKYYKRILIYELIISLLLQLSVYFVNISSKLNFLYIKTGIEEIAFLSFIIYCIINKMVPLYKQLDFEQRIRSDLVECLEFKYRRFFKIFLIFGIHCIWTIINPLIEKNIIYSYLNNYHLHFLFKIFYEGMFCLGLNIIFIPRKLPRYFYDEIIYNYKGLVFLVADVYEEDDEENHNKKLNISKLSFKDLKKVSKKTNFPIILLNPFASSKDQLLINDIHLGIAQKYQKD